LSFLGYFFNEPTKSSLIGEKSPNLVTLLAMEQNKLVFVPEMPFPPSLFE
jgi:hypothetical protein